MVKVILYLVWTHFKANILSRNSGHIRLTTNEGKKLLLQYVLFHLKTNRLFFFKFKTYFFKYFLCLRVNLIWCPSNMASLGIHQLTSSLLIRTKATKLTLLSIPIVVKHLTASNITSCYQTVGSTCWYTCYNISNPTKAACFKHYSVKCLFGVVCNNIVWCFLRLFAPQLIVNFFNG